MQTAWSFPRIIQGGMGIGVSQWRLARAVSQAGGLGLVSLVGIPFVVARQLQDGDEGGHLQRAFSHFPVPEVAKRVFDTYYIPGGRPPGFMYKLTPLYTADPSQELVELITMAAFSHVWLAKEGHAGMVGVNTVEKIQLPHLPALFGSILAGADVVVIGAGVPAQIPRVLESLARCEPTQYELSVRGARAGQTFHVKLDPRSVLGDTPVSLKKPAFFPIVSSVLLAEFLLGSGGNDGVDAFVVEGASAGGHSAPPRGKLTFNERGEPVYGNRDEVKYDKMARLGKPFYWAGGVSEPEKAREAVENGAVGIQSGTIFALSEESSFRPDIKALVRKLAYNGQLEVLSDPRASSTGFPFKVAQLTESLANADLYDARRRICDIGMSRDVFLKDDDTLGYACAAGPIKQYERISGSQDETAGRKCLCNGLTAAVGLTQTQKGDYVEPPLVTLGKSVSFVRHLMKHEDDSYTARDAVEFLSAAIDG